MSATLKKLGKHRKLIRIVIVLLILSGGYIYENHINQIPSGGYIYENHINQIPSGSRPNEIAGNHPQNKAIGLAIANQQSDVQVKASGKVIKILPDDTQGSRHQRFLVKLSSGDVILIAHNIDLADRVGDLTEGEMIAFYGEYEWNSKGGVVHWTHRDPRNKHPSGWLQFRGQTYQ